MFAEGLDPEITPEWLHDLLQANPAIQGRNYRGVALQIANKIDTTKDELHTITKQHILESIQEYLDNKQHIYYVDPYETNWDRRERLHVENMFNQYLASKQLNFLEETLEDNSLFSPDQRIILQQLLDFHKK